MMSGVRPTTGEEVGNGTTSVGGASSEVTRHPCRTEVVLCLLGLSRENPMAKTTAGERQTSNKAGVRSLAKKMGNTRRGFESQPASHKKAGAFAQESRPTAGRAKPGTSATREGKAAALRRVKMP
jgi:hypothetical protein